MSPQLAWNPFYKDRLRESWCIGKRCKDPEWDDEGEEEIEDIEKEEVGENKQLEKSEKVDMTPTYTNSEKSESPFLSADAHLPSSSCLAGVLSFLFLFIKRFPIPLSSQRSVGCGGDLER